MGRPPLPVWDEFETLVPASKTQRRPCMACRYCRKQWQSARPEQLYRHVSLCPSWPPSRRVERVEPRVQQAAQQRVSREEQAGLHDAGETERVEPRVQQRVDREEQAGLHDADETERVAEEQDVVATGTLAAPLSILGKRPRPHVQQGTADAEPVEQVLRDVKDAMNALLECKRQELQLRREELEFQREAEAARMEFKRQRREEERRDRREQRDADRQERLELARIENEKNLAFLKAVMEARTSN